MKINKKEEKSELEILQDIRTNAKNDKQRLKAQAAIDEYFLGSGRKTVKKKKSKIRKPIEDEWGY